MSGKSTKVLITGSNGLLGRKIIALYANNTDFEIVATSRGENRISGISGYTYRPLDVTRSEEVMNLLGEIRPDVVIHTAAMTQVDDCETQPERCRLLNVDAVQNVVNACEEIKAHLVHLSTDFIFDGASGPYDEEALANPLSVYGHSKEQSEGIVKSAKCPWSIVRTVLLIGIEPELGRSNIVLWALKSLSEGKEIRVVDDQFRTPTLAEDLAIGCMLIAAQRAEGIFNISGPDQMSIIELVHRVARFWKLDESLINRVSSAELNQPAVRPPITGFKINKARKLLGYAPRTFEEALALMAKQIDNR